MKKILQATIYHILFIFCFQADAQNLEGSFYIINGGIAGVDSGKIYMLSSDRKVSDSAVIKKGKFTISGKLDFPERKVFKIQPGNWEFGAYVDAPHITIDLDTTGAEHYYSGGKDYPMITKLKETGSQLADADDLISKETGKEEYLALGKKLNFSRKDSVAFIKSKMDLLAEAFPKKVKFWIENYVRQNPTSIPGIYFFKVYYSELNNKSPDYLRAMLAQFSGSAKASPHYVELINKLSMLENVQIGKLAPDFTLLKRDKKKFSLQTTRGSLVMLDFWASWCVPCRASIPNWRKVYSELHDKGFEIVSVSDDRNWSDWTKALDQEKMPWIQVADEFPSKGGPAIVGELYAIHTLPHYILISKKGEILIASGDEQAVIKKIEEILSN